MSLFILLCLQCEAFYNDPITYSGTLLQILQGGAAIWSRTEEPNIDGIAYASRGNLLVDDYGRNCREWKHFGVPADKVIVTESSGQKKGSEDHYDHQLVVDSKQRWFMVERILETVDRLCDSWAILTSVRSMYQNDPDLFYKLEPIEGFPGMTIKEFNALPELRRRSLFYLDSDGVFARWRKYVLSTHCNFYMTLVSCVGEQNKDKKMIAVLTFYSLSRIVRIWQ
ncbi:hypothetical protein SPFM6_00020 [Salmonella phage SPFM6]|nr:hypothetical protein SPFM6_00020 [Salmonella phage SPFM6]